MPYIKSDDGRRKALRNGEPALIAGELNYQIFYYIKHINEHYDIENEWCIEDIKRFVEQFLGRKPNYQRYNDMAGCLSLCYKEIKRRLKIDVKDLLSGIMESYDDEIVKYEKKKIIENGDVE